MQVAVTGGSGQLGTHVLRRLGALRGVKRVVSIDIRPPMLASGKVHAVHADVRDAATIGRALVGCDAVIHLAFIVAGAPPRRVFDAVNVTGSENVFKAAVDAGIKRILYASSVAAYGVRNGHPVPITEDARRIDVPDFAYSSAKVRVEAFLDELERAHPDLSVTRMRPGVLIGRYMDHPLGAAMRARRMVVVDDVRAPIVWDEDVADAFVLALNKPEVAHGAFNLVADDSLTQTELARVGGMRVVHAPKRVALAAARLSRPLARLGVGTPMDAAWIEHGDAEMILSSAKAREVLGWKPKCSTSADVIRRFVSTVPARTDLRVELFMRLAGFAAKRAPPMPESANVRARVHLALTGPAGADYTLVVDDGRADIVKGIPRPPTATLTLSTATFLEMMAGRSDIGTAQLSGKVRVEGEPMSMMILGGIVQMFRKSTADPGARGLAARRMALWFAA